ncbi:hypothetical protein ACFO4L_13170 [Bacillus daqingensis]|uniref:Uncharacterized protein n=1 Tax=Bacillus daqingensis TaxID=872396 RepID=A0ABV9NVY3_9BACI
MKILTALLVLLLAAACTNESPDAVPAEEDGTVELIFGDQEVSFTAGHYERMTNEALDLFAETAAPSQRLDAQLERWFIRYYIQRYEYNESWSPEDILLFAHERSEFETLWREYALIAYEVEVTEEMVENHARYNVELYEGNMPASVQGMSEALDISPEDFFLEFDRDHIERSVIWEELYPLLEEEYNNASDEGNSISIANAYNEEVMLYMESGNELYP